MTEKNHSETARPVTMLFSDFQEHCRTLKPKLFIYNDQDSEDKAACTGEVHSILFFDNIIFMWTPNTICLKGEGGTISFSNFDSITVEEHSFYDAVYLECKATGNKYCFMMDY